MGGTRQHTPVSTPRGSSLHPSAKCFTAHRQDPESPPAPYGRVPACNLGGRKSWSISISISLLRSDGFVFEPDLGKFDFSLLLRVHSLRDKNQLSATALSCSLVFFFFCFFLPCFSASLIDLDQVELPTTEDSLTFSTVPATRYLVTKTCWSCPSRCALPIAWLSTLGFHCGSKMKMWLATVRFSLRNKKKKMVSAWT